MRLSASADTVPAVFEIPDGPVTREQARAAGLTEADIRRALARGTWTTLRRGVYVEAGLLARVRDDPARRHALEVSGLLCTLDCAAVAAGTSAARIWGLETLTRPTEIVVVTADSRAKGDRREGYVIRTATLPAHHCRTRHGVPLTSTERTVVDLARAGSLTEGVVVADSAQRLGLVSVDQLRQVLGDYTRWPGAGRAHRAVELSDPRSESVLESVSRVAIHEQGLPAPRLQISLGDDRGYCGRVDFLWDEFRVIGEADGLGKYEPSAGRATRDIVRAEKRREELLADLGFEVVRWGWEDAADPAWLAQRLRAAFARGVQRQRGRLAG